MVFRPKAYCICNVLPWRKKRVCSYIHYLFVLYFCSLLSAPCSVLCLYFCLLAADAALKEEHVIDGRTIDVKRAVPRDRAPLPRLVRVMRVDFSGWVGDLRKHGVVSSDPRVRAPVHFLRRISSPPPPLLALCCAFNLFFPCSVCALFPSMCGCLVHRLSGM